MELIEGYKLQREINKDMYNYLNSLLDKVDEETYKEINEKLDEFYIRMQNA